MHEMSPDQRNKHLRKVLNAEVGECNQEQQAISTATSTSTIATLPISYNSMATSGVDVPILSSIWTKAEKYLGLPNAIIEEPTDDLTKKFKVFSKSHADKPNVVIVDQDRMVHCPCLMFTTSPNLCSHAVPVAHKQGILESFLDNVREKATCGPNLYAVSTVNVNTRSAGQKGGRERRKRSKTPRPSATVTLERNFCCTDGVTASNTSQAVTYPATPQMSTHPATLQMVTHSATPHMSTHPPTIHPGTSQLSTHSATLHPGIFQMSTHPTALQMATHSGTSQMSTPLAVPQMFTHSKMARVATPPNFSLPRVAPYKQPWHNSNLFVVMAITNRVKKCAGCPFEHSNPHGPTFTGLVIQHKERDTYHDKEGNIKISNESNRYYHVEPACVLSRHPYFTPNLLTLHEGAKLNTYQSRHLLEKFGVSVRGSE